jgi:hypothetical protein
MPDFKSLVRRRLHDWHHRDREQVVHEIAGHPGDRYEELLRDGLASQKALNEALSEVRDWQEPARAIEFAKRGAMIDREKGIWISALAALVILIIGEILVSPVHLGGPATPGRWWWLTEHAAIPILAAALAVTGAVSWAADLGKRVWIPGMMAILVGTFGGLIVGPILLPAGG